MSLNRSINQTDVWSIFLLIPLISSTAEYKAEKIQAPKVSWHQDPRFHDSSSEEEEQEEEEEEQKQSSSETKNTE